MVQSDNATEPYGDREDVGVEQPFVGALMSAHQLVVVVEQQGAHVAGAAGAGGGREVLVEAGVLVPQPVPLTVNHGERYWF